MIPVCSPSWSIGGLASENLQQLSPAWGQANAPGEEQLGRQGRRGHHPRMCANFWARQSTVASATRICNDGETERGLSAPIPDNEAKCTAGITTPCSMYNTNGWFMKWRYFLSCTLATGSLVIVPEVRIPRVSGIRGAQIIPAPNNVPPAHVPGRELLSEAHDLQNRLAGFHVGLSFYNGCKKQCRHGITSPLVYIG